MRKVKVWDVTKGTFTDTHLHIDRIEQTFVRNYVKVTFVSDSYDDLEILKRLCDPVIDLVFDGDTQHVLYNGIIEDDVVLIKDGFCVTIAGELLS